MRFPLRTLMTSTLLFLVVFQLPDDAHAVMNMWRHTARNIVGRHNTMGFPKHHHHIFGPVPWKQAHATFYEGGSGTFGGACGYEDVVKEGFGLESTAALSSALFNEGQSCGACYEIQCINSPQGCKAGQPSILVTATNLCPPSSEWCYPSREHFDLAKPAFLKIADSKAGVVSVQYRRVPCERQGGVRFTITGNPYFNLIKVSNVGGAGDITGVQVKGDGKVNWTDLKRNWGQKWETNAMLVGQKLTFRVRTSDGRYSTSWDVTPKNWQFGQTFEGKNFA